MIGLVMAGGKGTRMNLDGEKLLLKYKKPIILHVVDSLNDSKCFSKILALTSSNSPMTKKLLEQNKIDNKKTKISLHGIIKNETYVLLEKFISNLEIIDSAQRITKQILNFRSGAKRAGDPAMLTASSEKFDQFGSWRKYSLDDMIQHAWNWYVRQDKKV